MDIHVGSIPFKWTEKNLIALFEEYGEVASAKIVMDKITRQNKGFAFVNMPNDDEAMVAIQKLNGAEYDERTITVAASLPKIEVRKPQRSAPQSSTKKKGPMEFKSEKHKNSVPPWMRKEY